jgi:LPXTG-motif cell wall-anchored protein
MRRLVAGGAIVAASLVSLGAPASAAEAPLYPPQPPDITLNINITIIIIGGTVNLTFIGCQIGENVEITLGGNSTLTVCSGGGGGASRLAQVPASGGVATASITAPLVPGEYIIRATGLTSGYTASQRLTVRPSAEGIGTMTPIPAPAAPISPSAPASPASPAAPAAPAAPAGSATPRRAQLPSTGSDDVQTAWIAGSTLLVGLGLYGASKRRRHRPAA